MEHQTGTVLRGPDGQVAVRMGPDVKAGAYYVVAPNSGGFFVRGPAQIADIATWAELTSAP